MSAESTSDTSSCPQHVVDFIIESKLHGEYTLVDVEECLSAQQRVWIVRLQATLDNTPSQVKSGALDDEWQQSLQRGRNRLVIRQWLGGCQWWNLNRNSDPGDLARGEIIGYRWSRQAFDNQNSNWQLVIPKVLHVELNRDRGQGDEARTPWAVMEYVGHTSTYFQEDSLRYASHYLDGMVKVRHEFGFDEPHPRWGRVPENEVMEYASMILDQAMLPLHQESEKIVKHESETSGSNHNVFDYSTMVSLYQKSYEKLKSHVNQHYANSSEWKEATSVLDVALGDILPANLLDLTSLRPVLVHMDWQPQNVLLARTQEGSCRVSSVLDWEDAALADPRFDVILMCRKVCANQEQAESLWKLYGDRRSKVMLESPSPDIFEMGPITPWLQLETVHSMLTLLLQSMDMLDGGRNPWETSVDLRDKLQREMRRWKAWSKSTSTNADSYLADLGIHPDQCYLKC